jgi:hypothetical protein
VVLSGFGFIAKNIIRIDNVIHFDSLGDGLIDSPNRGGELTSHFYRNLLIMNIPTNVTRRDAYIITQAFTYASEWLKSLGDHRDEPSNRADMDTILAAMNSSFVTPMRWQARNNLANCVFSSSDEMATSLNEMSPAAEMETSEQEVQLEAVSEPVEVWS